MNLRLPAVAAVVVAAAGAAAFRAAHQPPPEPAVSLTAGSSRAATAPGVMPLAAGGPASRPRRPVARVTVYVAGAVARAGVYALPAGARGADALHAAGGPRVDADLVAVNLAQPLEDGEEIAVPVVGADPAPAGGCSARGTGSRAKAKHRKRGRRHRRHAATAVVADADPSGSTADPAADPPVATVDLNAADENELETLPGIGASLAERIVTFRAINGPFASADDLLDVGGMTQGRLDAIEPYITVGGK